MKQTGINILTNFKKRWQLLLCLKIAIMALGPAILMFFILNNLLWATLAFSGIVGLLAIIYQPWKIDLKSVSNSIDHQLTSMENSSGLLLVSTENLSGIARLQQKKVSRKLQDHRNEIKPGVKFGKTVIFFFTCAGIGFILYQFHWFDTAENLNSSDEQEEIISFKPIDSVAGKTTPPKLVKQELIVSYPSYTNISSFTASNMNVKAVEGTRLTWKLQFDSAPDSVFMESMGNQYPMNFSNETYTRSSTVTGSGFYNFRFTDEQNASYTSDLFAIEAFEDQSPVIVINDLKQFETYKVDESKDISFETLLTDDFGLGEAYIIATVSKGSGESVKFREEKLSFKESISIGKKRQRLSKTMNLDALKMEAGDELYFYVETLDLKRPTPNKARSETYFAVIQDTATTSFAVEGSMGADLMPEYFRSQRQLIIDTEKLIEERSKLSKEAFNTESNNLGFDQKALRIKYGQFMGDETEGMEAQNTGEGTEHESHDDPLAEYSHDHDGNNEHNLVEVKENHEEEDAKNPLSEYVHNHSDPEESTLFSNSLKSKLRQALNIMWDAELYLRMYEPEKSLAYQYKALALIQEIKNSARIYVHRIGFDPPPIKDDVRLSGDLEEVSSFRKKENLEEQDASNSMRLAIGRLEDLKNNPQTISEEDKKLFENAGDELAVIAINQPGNYLDILQQLKSLTGNLEISEKTLTTVQHGLLKAVGELKPSPAKNIKFSGQLNNMVLEELAKNDE
ncbi:conserved hypothetical protein, membrane [Christiangramia forsetii KT0803]|uniref:Tryptophan-rich sensory protein n=3 Tax=Christiangramia forsetii TaxID=411153 RepID=A0M2Q5_CHRFK|nr:conserved hypothetical protein, membrane [Christiangramia forsetii KT0803]